MKEVDTSAEREPIVVPLLEVAKKYLTDDEDREELGEWLLESDADEQDYFGYVYGRLLELGHDPDEIFAEEGLIE